MLLTQRASHLRAHSGQVAFPGGKIDPGETALETALREAREEIGLEARFVEPLGWLDPYLTGTGFRIAPLVGAGRAGLYAAINPHEVEAAFETPLAFLMDEANHQIHEREWGGRRTAILRHAARRPLYLGRDGGHVAQPLGEAVPLMARAVFETFGLFLRAVCCCSPSFLCCARKFPLAVEHWTRGRLSWLALAGLAAAAFGLVVLNAFAPRGHGRYVPAHLENGVIVPGRFE